MPYLFDQEVEEAIAKGFRPNDIKHLKEQCEAATAKLLLRHPRTGNYPADDPAAQALVESMGGFNVPAGAPHARQHVENWRQVSGNAQLMIDKVSRELAHAYQLELDIQSDAVIGKMYELAVNVWAMIDEYTGPGQDEGRR